MSPVAWNWHAFDALKPQVLYDLLELRSRVFVVEQNCVFLDLDGADVHCEHLCGYDRGKLVAYLRLVPPGVKFPEASIGRVVTDPAARGGGLARECCELGLARLRQRFPGIKVRIGAQQYLEAFYASLGFVTTGQPYIEDGIPHVDMVLDR